MSRLTLFQALRNPHGLYAYRLLAILASAENPDGTPYTLPVTPAPPEPANILAGRQAFVATSAATTLITIPAGRTWVGEVGASVSCAVNAGAASSGRASASISVSGVGATPPAGGYFGVDATVAANAATGTTGASQANFGRAPLVVSAPAGNAVQIQVLAEVTAPTGRVDAFASGSLLAT